MNCSGRRRRLKIALITLAIELLVLIAALILYFAVFSHAVGVSEALAGTDDVAVTETDFGWAFDGPGESAALVFYPGALIDADAYAPLMAELAEAGVDCYLVEMPMNLALFGVGRAVDIVERYDYDTWILAGHSLGGAMAAVCAANNPDAFDVLLLLAAYPTKALDDELIVVSLYGSEDGVLNLDKLESGRDYMPENYTEIVIEGGNHAQFGSYGAQSGDGEATISAEEQRAAVVTALLSALNEEEESAEASSEDPEEESADASSDDPEEKSAEASSEDPEEESADATSDDPEEETADASSDDPDAGIALPILTATISVTDFSDGVLTVSIDNQSGAEMAFGGEFTLEMESDGEWTALTPLDTAAWPEIVAVEDLSQAEITLDLTACFGTLSPGRYRLTLSGLSAEFDLD